jgi:hypothetical protein
MLKNALSLNRIANLFYITLQDSKKYQENVEKMSNLEKKDQLQKIIRLIDITLLVLDRKVKLKGISKEFVTEARKIKSKQKREDRNWYEYLNVVEWFK